MTTPAANPTVLIATIGERDPDGVRRDPAPEPAPPPRPTGPALAANRYLPGTVVLLATPGVQEPAELTRQALASQLGIEPATEWLEGDPSDFDAMQQELWDALQRLRRTLPQDADIVICPTSGTPQVGQALTIVGMYLFPQATFVQALDPRHEPDDARRLRTVDPRATRVRFDLERAARALRDGHWLVAQDILQEVGAVNSQVVHDQRPAIAAAVRLARGMALAEDLDFAQAGATLKPAAGEANQSVRSALERLSQWYRGLARQGQANPALPAELAAMAERQRRAGALSRAAVTAAMAWETALTVALRIHGRLNPDALRAQDLQRLPEDLRDAARQLDPSRSRLEGQYRRRQALEHLHPPTRQLLEHQGEVLERLAELRNDVVHTGALRQDAGPVIEQALDAIDALLASYGSGWTPWRQAPTTPEALRELAQRVAGAWLPAGA